MLKCKRFLCLIFVSLICASFSFDIQAANFHVFMVGDTEDESLSAAFQNDLDMMDKQVKEIAKQTGLKLKLTTFNGTSVTPENILSQLDLMQVGKDDVVFLYFTMHGYRTQSKKNPWPSLYFGVSGVGVDYQLLTQIIQEKHPRLLLAIADSCNSYLPAGAYIPTIMKNNFGSKDSLISVNYKKLFLEGKGTIIISGSHPGQYSWSDGKVSIYTVKFLESLKEVVSGQEPADWSIVLDKATQKVVKTTTTYKGMQRQDPQVEAVLQ